MAKSGILKDRLDFDKQPLTPTSIKISETYMNNVASIEFTYESKDGEGGSFSIETEKEEELDGFPFTSFDEFEATYQKFKRKVTTYLNTKNK